jgi:replicative DNA helicase
LIEITPSYSNEIEMALIGALLLDSDMLPMIRTQMSAECFYTPRHRETYHAILKCYDDMKSIDMVIVSDLCEFEAAASFMVDCVEITSGAKHLNEYVTALVELEGKRRLSNALKTTLSRIPEVRLLESLETMTTALHNITAVSGDDAKFDMAAAATEAIVQLQARIERGGGLLGPSTGFRSLDKMLGGLRPGAITVIGGRPGSGKSSLALQIADSVARQNSNTLFISLEMTVNQSIYRMAGQRTGITSCRIEQGDLSVVEADRAMESIAKTASYPLTIIDRDCFTLAEIERLILLANIKAPLSVVIIDFIQLVKFPGSRDPRHRQIGIAIETLCAISKNIGIHIVLCSQLNRALDSRSIKIPQLSDLKESGDIEQGAAHVMFVCRPDEASSEQEKEQLSHGNVIVAKNRFGKYGTVNIFMRPETTSFAEVSDYDTF